MKARVKETGQFADVMFVCNDSQGKAVFKTTYQDFYNEDELDFDDIQCEFYWEKLKHQYAGMAMQGLLNNSLLAGELKKDPNNGIAEMSNTITKAAVIYATALVEKLKNSDV